MLKSKAVFSYYILINVINFKILQQIDNKNINDKQDLDGRKFLSLLNYQTNSGHWRITKFHQYNFEIFKNGLKGNEGKLFQFSSDNKT